MFKPNFASFQQIVGVMMEIDDMKTHYENMVSSLLDWIQGKILELREDFTRSLPIVQKEMLRFKHFRTVEKPPKYVLFRRNFAAVRVNLVRGNKDELS